MKELPYIDSPILFQQELKRIASLRKAGKIKTKREFQLTKDVRKIIHAKTGGLCHVCGQEILVDKFEADHVKSHSSGGTCTADNFLPACKTCNNYRWHYLSDEFQWILKLGVWARTQIANDNELGKLIAKSFISSEKIREGRRKTPRIIPNPDKYCS